MEININPTNLFANSFKEKLGFQLPHLWVVYSDALRDKEASVTAIRMVRLLRVNALGRVSAGLSRRRMWNTETRATNTTRTELLYIVCPAETTSSQCDHDRHMSAHQKHKKWRQKDRLVEPFRAACDTQLRQMPLQHRGSRG